MSCVVVYGRQPVEGRVKTRLAAELGDQLATELYGILLDHTLREAGRSDSRVILSLSDPPDAEWAAGLEFQVEIQRGPGLGDRLAATFAARFSEGQSRVVVVGSDCPGIGSQHLDRAFHLLSCVPVVVGPADDGGYWLVGQRAPGADLFDGIPWSTPTTLRETRRRLLEVELGWRELERLEDIDCSSALDRVMASQQIAVSLRVQLEEALRRRRPPP